jgi:hypothetical protein
MKKYGFTEKIGIKKTPDESEVKNKSNKSY